MIYNESVYNQQWDTKKLSDLGIFERGKSKYRPRNDKRLFEGGGYPLVQTGEIKDANFYITHHEQEYGEFGLKQSKLWDAETLCITIAANIAETALLSYPMCFPDSVVGFRAYKNISSEKFMYYVFEYIRRSIQNSVTGSIQDNINIEYLTSLEFKIPTKKKQDNIVSLLSAIDEKILLNNKINDYLENQALLIFSHMFHNISYGSNHVGDYITPRRGKALLSKDAIPGCVPVIAGGLVPATYHNASNTVAPVLTISGSGANAGYVNIWYDSVWSSDSSYIDSNMTANVYFWYAFLKSRQQDIYDIQTGSAQPHIYPTYIAELSIGEIDNAIVKSYTSQVTPLFEKIGANIREINKLKQLRNWLLPMLMNGQATIED